MKWNFGEPDESGRRRPIEKNGSEFTLEVDSVIMALGTRPNPIVLGNDSKVKLDDHGCVVINEENGQTSDEKLFAGGDITTGSATVILAMGAGKKAAKGIDEYLKNS